MILLSENELPDESEVPDGFRYYMYHVEKDGDGCYGCFIGQSPDDIFEIPDICEYADALAEVAEIDREHFVDFHATLKDANLRKQMESTTDD